MSNAADVTMIRSIATTLSKAIVFVMISVVKGYKMLLSPLFPASCRFEPSCSSYSIDALQKYGLFKGVARSIWRIVRCNPFNKGGYDPA